MDTWNETQNTLEHFWSQDQQTKNNITNAISPLFTNKDLDIATFLDVTKINTWWLLFGSPGNY